METAIKPGTRCECRDHGCYAENRSGPSSHGYWQCNADAVRMVTLKPRKVERNGYMIWAVPMCAPCAEYASKAGAR